MKRILLWLVLAMATTLPSLAQYPNVTIRQIQEMPLDSLLVADSLQLIGTPRWTLQASPYYQDTVTITAVCVVPAKTITFTQRGWTMLLADTGANPYPWGGILVRVGAAVDTGQAVLDGFTAVERGDVIRMTGRVDEFTGGTMTSTTQFVPIPMQPIQIIGSAPVPQYVNKQVTDFYTGIYPGGRVKYSTGEPYEGALVNLATPLTVDAKVNPGRGTFSMIDAGGNQITDYDGSRYFTLKGTSSDHPYPDSIWSIIYPSLAIPTQVDTMRGFITTVSGSETPRGFRISPLYRAPYAANDVVFGIVLPSVTTHRRNPIVVPSDSAARISARVTRQTGGYPLATVSLLYSLNNGPLTNVQMTYQASDTTYVAQIPQQPENTFVHYFIKAVDSLGNGAILASSAFGGASSDTSKGFFFYTVLNRALTINDIQYTPYLNGRTPFLGATVTVKGIVTADTNHLRVSPISGGGASVWYMQNGNQPWNGIWFVPAVSDSLTFLRNGDSVTVTGSVAEEFDVTRLQGVTPVIVHTSGNPEPLPVLSTTGAFAANLGNGTPSAEQYEGMLVRFNNVRVSARYPEFNDRREFEINDGTGAVRVLRDGTHNISNDTLDIPFGYTVLNENDTIRHVVGIIYYSFNKYKFVPRTNADFGAIITDVDIDHDPVVPQTFSLAQNFPNPFNPSTVIEYSLPTSGYVTLRIYNILGQEVKTLVSDMQSPGKYSVRFDASSYASGLYFYQLRAGEFLHVKKMLLLK